MKRMLGLMLAAAVLLLSGCVQIAETGNIMPYEAASLQAVQTPDPQATATPALSSAPEEMSGALVGVGAEPSATPAVFETPAVTPLAEATPELMPSPTPTATPAPSSTPAYPVEPMEEKAAYLNAGSANLREGPGTDYAILEELFENEKLVVTGKSGEWYRVEADNEVGFILAEFVEFGSVPTPAPTPSYKVKEMEDTAAYVNAGSANLRKGPGKSYEIIVELDRNEKITVTGTSGDWYRVEYGSKKGFITKELVKLGTVPTPTPSPTPKATPSPTPSSSPTASALPTVKPTAAVSPTKEPEKLGTGSGNGYGVDPYDYFSDGGGFTAAELLLLAQVVQEEAKGTSVEARAAVANTIYNRYLSSNYPNDIEKIIFQKNQYTVADDEAEIRSVKPIADTVKAVKQIFVDHDTFLPEDVHFFRQKSRGTSWGDKRIYYATYGNNAFFRSLYGEFAR